MTGVKTTCPYCGVGCGVVVSGDGHVTGDTHHPANFGRLCSKGTALGQTLDDNGRLLTPQIDGQSADWDSALALVADTFRAAINRYGPDSVALYVSGQLLTEDYYVANKLMKGYIGSANIDTNSRLCMASSVAGHKRAFGADTVPGQYEDFEEADLVVLVGSNLAWCHPVIFQRLSAAKAARPEMRVVVIDPRRTATCQLADLHLPIRVDGDTTLFNLLLRAIDTRGLIDRAYVDNHVTGLAETLAATQDCAASETGLPVRFVEAFIDLWCASEKVVTLYSQGVNQSRAGTDKVNAILNCHLATGRIGRPGTGPFSVTGQPNAMGGREVGGLANMLACHLDLENADHRHAVREFWGAPRIADTPGLKAVDLFQACADGRIKALWIMSTNPAVSLPDADAVAAAIRKVPFAVVSDIIADTDTNACADVLLPATGWGEKSGTVTNSERRISRQRAFRAAPGDARPDWDIIAEVGRRMGWTDAFDYTNPAEIFREHAALSGVAARFGRDFDISGLAQLSDAEYDTLEPTVWPVPTKGTGAPRFFADGGFYHADGKAKMIPVAPSALPQPAIGQFVLNTGRIRDQWHTMTRTGLAGTLSAHLAEPFVEIHPLDAEAIGINDAELVRIDSAQGHAILRVLITDRVSPGTIFAPMHWNATNASAARVNALVAPVTDPVSGQPALKSTPVSVTRYAVGWYGFATGIAEMTPARPYAAVARTGAGWRAELAGHRLPDDWIAEARDVLNLKSGEASLFEDRAAGLTRVAISENGLLSGLFFAAQQPVAVARSATIALIGTDTKAHMALAGRPGAGRPLKGPTICACFDVGRDEIIAAIAQGANTPDKIGAFLRAGTNCGSCRPELQALIAGAPRSRMAAE